MNKEEKQEIVNVNEIVLDLLTILGSQSLNTIQITEVLSNLMFSIGTQLENYVPTTSAEVEKRYGENPTLGNALMAQSIWMRDVWIRKQEENE